MYGSSDGGRMGWREKEVKYKGKKNTTDLYTGADLLICTRCLTFALLDYLVGRGKVQYRKRLLSTHHSLQIRTDTIYCTMKKTKRDIQKGKLK